MIVICHLLTSLQDPVRQHLPQLRKSLPRAGTDKHTRHRHTIELIHIPQNCRLTFGLNRIQFVEDQNLRHVIRTNFRQNFLNLLDLFRETGVGCIHNMQQQVGVNRLLQSGLESIHQTVRQIADKADRVRQLDRLFGF